MVMVIRRARAGALVLLLAFVFSGIGSAGAADPETADRDPNASRRRPDARAADPRREPSRKQAKPTKRPTLPPSPRVTSTVATEIVYPMTRAVVRVGLDRVDSITEAGERVRLIAYTSGPCAGEAELGSARDVQDAVSGTMVFDVGVAFPKSAAGRDCPLEMEIFSTSRGRLARVAAGNVSVAPMSVYDITHSWDLQPYFKARTGDGLCKGSSTGTAGIFPVGVIEFDKDITWEMRGGFPSVICRFQMSRVRLNHGWIIESTKWSRAARKKPNQCYSEAGSAPPSIESTENPVQARREFPAVSNQWRCPEGSGNAYGVHFRLDEVKLYGPANRTWKQGLD
jgi:hypothetical protein